MANGKPMSKSQLAGHIAEGTGITKKTAGEILDLLASTAYSEAKSKGEFTVPGLVSLLPAYVRHVWVVILLRVKQSIYLKRKL